MTLHKVFVYTQRNMFHIAKLPLLYNKNLSFLLSNPFVRSRATNSCNCLGRSYHTSLVLMKRRKSLDERKAPKLIEYSPKSKTPVVEVWNNITVSELANVLKRDIYYVQDLFLNNVRGKNTVINDLGLLQDAIKRSGNRMRVIGKPKFIVEEDEEKDVFPRPPANKADLKPRPPVITIMGHVDHGKTTLLDALRNTNVVDGEFGGITQHIGAFSVELKSGAKITFLDTPGHSAFTAMRERGANVTDIVVLVVAADDGVMEQTIESVRMARQAKVPILVAINKIDSPKADVERTKRNLIEIGIQVESMGGDVQAIPISALKKQNLDQLVEALYLQADLQEIKADPNGFVEAVVIESRVDQYRGSLTTLIIQRGTLRVGNILIAGTSVCKVRALQTADRKNVKEMTPGNPIEVEGWRSLPSAGDQVLQVETEKKAKLVAKVRENKNNLEKQQEDAVVISMKEEEHKKQYKEKLKIRRRLGKFKMKPTEARKKEIIYDTTTPELNMVVKADVNGTLEALLNTLNTYENEDCKLELINEGVGDVTENDIEMAQLFNGVVYAFNVKCKPEFLDKAKENNVSIKFFNVIYKLIDDVKEQINQRLPQKEVEEINGEATVMKQFDINEGRKKIPVAGCKCEKGVLKASSHFRLVRNDQVIYDGMLSSMRHLKSEVDSVKKGLECGLQLTDKSITFLPGDTLICYDIRMEPQKTNWDPGF